LEELLCEVVRSCLQVIIPIDKRNHANRYSL
jgi:hypothetical protein